MMTNAKKPKLEAPKYNRPNAKTKSNSAIDFQLANLRKLSRGPSCSTLSCEYPADLSNTRVSTGGLRICRENLP